MDGYPYRYAFDRRGRKGQPCKVTARGTMNSCRVGFPCGFTMITSRNALRRRDGQQQEATRCQTAS